jgi:hypothetical protein
MSRFSKFILSLFCGCCLCSSAEADDLDPVSHAYLLDKKYAKHIEIKAYIATKDQIVKVFSEENAEVNQKINKELYGQEVYLLVRCKNKGDYRSFGTLNCKLSNSGGFISIEIMMMPGYMKSFRNTILPLSGGGIPNDNKIPVITFEWKNLYTY